MGEVLVFNCTLSPIFVSYQRDPVHPLMNTTTIEPRTWGRVWTDEYLPPNAVLAARSQVVTHGRPLGPFFGLQKGDRLLFASYKCNSSDILLSRTPCTDWTLPMPNIL